MDSRTYVGKVFFCSDFCSSLLTACSGAALGDKLVSDLYTSTDGDRFCYDLFGRMDGNLSVVPFVSKYHCFTDERRQCTADDITGHYTECDENGVRQYFYTHKDGVDCSGGYKTPAPVTNLPCRQVCSPGSYLPAASTQCTLCPDGTFSLGGGEVFDQWKEWPLVGEWDSYCESTDGENINSGTIIPDCQGWIPNGFGVNTATIKDSQNAVMRLRISLVRAGSISFSFKVTAEVLYDGLAFFVDDVLLMTQYSNSDEYIQKSFNLTAGTHIIRWVFFKDSSHSDGDDSAMIRSISIVGISYADSACTPCSEGSYASSAGASQCLPCPSNTKSDIKGATSCTSCPQGTYSHAGSMECTPRPACTADDYSASHTPCVQGVRNLVYSFNEPITCDTSRFTLPPNSNGVPCAPCNAGQYRPAGSSSCLTCPSGYYADVGATFCTPCQPGTFAKKRLFYTQFDSWSDLPGVTTFCQGDCGTNGWRLLGKDIDSGVGHGALVDVFLTTQVVLEVDGYFYWNFSVICNDFCRYKFIDLNSTNTIYTFSAAAGTQTGPYAFRMQLKAGFHLVQVVFSKYMPSVQSSRNNRLIIHEFSVSGVVGGGASYCGTCNAGDFSQAASTVCTPCPLGYTSPNASGTCTLCPEGTYSARLGASSCAPCGPNTKSTPDRQFCDYNGCKYEPSPGILYDLSPLETQDDMYGPVWDVKNHAFYLNPCKRQHQNRTCYDSNGTAILSHACQELPPSLGYAMDLGHTMGYLPFDDKEHAIDPNDPLRSGIIMTFDRGTKGCAKLPSLPAFHRSTNITFICDPSAGKGYPEALEPVEYSPCKYQFKWKSLYACPLCTAQDYTAVYGSCDNGYTTVTYVPKTIPNRCHSGVPLPAPELVPCTSAAKNCTPGTYFPLDSRPSGSCSPASPGHFTIGGGYVLDWFPDWASLPSIVDKTSSWKPLQELIRSGVGDTELVIRAYLVQGGYLSYTYKVIGESLAGDEGFYFKIDDSIRQRSVKTTYYRYFSMSMAVTPGDHVFSWRFIGGTEPSAVSRGSYVALDRILIYGTEYAARQEIPCRSGYYQSQEGQTYCYICPENTRSIGGQASCFSCPNQTYSLRGSSECQLMTRCQMRDYAIRYSTCNVNNKRTKYYLPISPKTCYDSGVLFQNNTEEECLPCQNGFYRSNGECVSCPEGQTYQVSSCINVPAGFRAIRNITYFSSLPEEPLLNVSRSILPDGFITFCSGRCGTDGWRILNNTIESGFHSVQSEVESILILEVDLVHEGQLSFMYTLSALRTEAMADDDGLPGLQFLLDDIPQERAIPYHPAEDTPTRVVFPRLSVGKHTFTWVFHQPLGTNRHKRVILTDINVLGSSVGGSSAIAMCDRGTFSEVGASKCNPCPPGSASELGVPSCVPCMANTYAESWGTAQCIPCGEAMTVTSDHTACDTHGCVFSNADRASFNLSTLDKEFSLYSEDKKTKFALSLCGKLSRNSGCFNAQNRLLNNTHVCAITVENGVGNDAGHFLNVFFDPIYDQENVEYQLRLVYDKGEPCGLAGQKQTNVKFVCDPNVTGPVPPTIQSVKPCVVEMTWAHVAGCRVCGESDYEEQSGPCIDGQRETAKVRFSKCNGPAVKSVLMSPCKKSLDISFFFLVLLFVLFIALALSVAVIFIRHKKMADRYEMLVNSSSTNSLPSVTADTP